MNMDDFEDIGNNEPNKSFAISPTVDTSTTNSRECDTKNKFVYKEEFIWRQPMPLASSVVTK